MFAIANTPLHEADPEIFDLIEKEKLRQFEGLELIASENFTSQAVMEANGSCLTNKYSEGYPNARYYGGNENIDKIEDLAKSRSLQCFGLSPEKWGVNVQPYSGSPANFEVYTALLNPHDRIMGLDLPSGGHLTHGYYTNKKKISASSIFFESMPYSVNPTTGLVDYAKIRELATIFRPKLLLCGASAYARDWDYATLRNIADSVGCLLHCDMAHYSGLVAAKELANPFDYCDIVTTTTHKSLRGPRAGVIFFRRGEKPRKEGSTDPVEKYDFEDRINFAVFPSCQGGPHNHQVAAIAIAMKDAMTPEFKAYAKQVRLNSKALAAALMSYGYKLVTDGTDNHLILWDLRPKGLTGSKVEKLFEKCHITVNKNAIPGDQNALNPGGVRVGTCALTSRGFKEADFTKVAEFLHRGINISVRLQETNGKLLKDFVAAIDGDAEAKQLAHDVKVFAVKFTMPGFDVTKMKYQPQI